MIKDLIKKFKEMRDLAGRRMNSRYEEFGDKVEHDYPEGCIGDPESIRYETELGVWSDALRMLQDFDKDVNERTLEVIEKILEERNDS